MARCYRFSCQSDQGHVKIVIMSSVKNIVIATPIYSPDIGGPATYAKELFESFTSQGYKVSIVSFGRLKRLPRGISNFCYFFKLLYFSIFADYIIALDIFSVGLPAVVCHFICGNKVVLRVGGDFLWEKFVNRTGNKVLLSEFYLLERKLSFSEKIIFILSKLTISLSQAVIFSTVWQKEIMQKPYDINQKKIKIIENYFPKTSFISRSYNKKIILSPSRNNVIKNKVMIDSVCRRLSRQIPDLEYDDRQVSAEVLREKFSEAYILIVGSLSEVSPNIVCEALKYGLPAILTVDNGLKSRLGDMTVFIDPLSPNSLEEGILSLLDPSFYASCLEAMKNNQYSHSWNEIAQEFIDLYHTL